MLLLVGVAFVAGLVTAISPCVLPVLPIVFAGGATGSHRRPYAIVAGLVASFTAFTLAATALVGALGIPDDLLRNIAVGIVLAIALSLLWPGLAGILEHPFRALGRRSPVDLGGGFLLGASLGLLFTPCAGPIIAAIATLAATERFSVDAVLVTLAYAAGAGLVLLAIAIMVRRGFALAPLRARAPTVRRVLGAVMVIAAVVMLLGYDTRLAANVPGYTKALQGLEESAAAQTRIRTLVGAPELDLKTSGRSIERLLGGIDADTSVELEDYGEAPDFQGIELWLNSPPLSLAGLRGKVVVIDFWTYSCVNCLRTLPHVTSWYETYRDDGLVVVGVHTPEFAFEREPANVRNAVRELGVTYPVALDNGYATWGVWGNLYWPAKYFVDRQGHVRYVHFGEGAYEESEQVIRTLLAEPGLPPAVSPGLPDLTPSGPQTPETYLGYERLTHYAGSQIRPHREGDYVLSEEIPLHGVAYGGRWTIEEERIVAGKDARLRLAYHARDVHLVLGTSGEAETAEVIVDGKRLGTVEVTDDRLYTLVDGSGEAGDHVLELRFSPGTEAYAFTFG